MFDILYIVTTDEEISYPDMALISILSVRITNPNLKIIVLFDRASFEFLFSVRHKILDYCDDIIKIDTPKGNSIFRNRWIKTQAVRYISKNALYLDADTLVRKPLNDLVNIKNDFAAVADNNGSTIEEQISEHDLTVLKSNDWGRPDQAYLNGGVWYFKNNERTQKFFKNWNFLWFNDFQSYSRVRDQPSFNTALSESEVDLDIIGREYNEQLGRSVKYTKNGKIEFVLGEDLGLSFAKDAKIWHLYACLIPMILSKVEPGLQLLDKNETRTLKLIGELIQSPNPIFPENFVGKLIKYRLKKGNRILSTPEFLLLCGKRKSAMRFTMSKCLKLGDVPNVVKI